MFSSISIRQETPDGTISISLNYVTDKTRYGIYSNKDQKILEEKIQTTEVKINNKLPAGTYYVKVFENDIINCIQKIIITDAA